MLNRQLLALPFIVFAANSALATDLFPPVAEIEVNRPRLLVRPGAPELAVPLAQLRSSAEDGDRPVEAAPVEARQTPRGIEVLLDGAKYIFAAEAPYAVTRGSGW